MVHTLREQIVANPPSQSGGMSITGQLLGKLAELYVTAINSGAAPAIRDSWSLLSETECRHRADEARQVFEDLVRQQQENTNHRYERPKARLS